METNKKSINDEPIYLNDGLKKQLDETLEKIKNIIDVELNPGEIRVRCSMIFNALDYLDFYIDCLKKYSENFDYRSIKMGVISLNSFYECYFKFWIRHKEIVNNPYNQFRADTIESKIIPAKYHHKVSAEAFKSGQFHTISLRDCLIIAKKEKLITAEEASLIELHNSYRNLFVHNEITGDKLVISYFRWPVIENALNINVDNFYDGELKIIEKLLKELKNALNDENGLINNLPKDDCLFLLVEYYFRSLEKIIIPNIDSNYLPELNKIFEKHKSEVLKREKIKGKALER